jgi:hypothetical protein
MRRTTSKAITAFASAVLLLGVAACGTDSGDDDKGGMHLTHRGPIEMRYEVTDERISSGLPRLDHMLRGGYHRGSNVLISGAPGTAKSTLSGLFVAAACQRGERTLYVSFDASEVRLAQDVLYAHARPQCRRAVRRSASHGARAQTPLPGG